MNVEKYFDRYAKEHTAQNRWRYFWYRWLVNTIIKEVQPKKSKTVLDLGTGSGIIPIHLSKKVKKIVAVDASTGMLNEAKKFARLVQLKNIEFKHSFIEKLKFENGEFDVVTTNLAIDHVKDKLKLAKQVYKWLKPNGLFIVGLPFQKEEKRHQKLIEEKRKKYPKTAKMYEKSLSDFFKSVSKKYMEEHPTDYDVGLFEFENILKKANFKTKIIPAYHHWFAIVIGKKS